ncbi:hypothetical protein VTK56DRAFT_4267 [Thermocarpiscus australiensis]
MDYTKEALLAALPAVSKSTRRLRKLQKNSVKHSTNLPCRPGSDTPHQTLTAERCDTPNIRPATQAQHRLSPFPRPDLSGPKWAEFVPGNGSSCLSCAQEWPSEARERLTGPVHIVPEFSRLLTGNSRPPISSNSDSPALSRPAMRRQAKTPIFSIEQLEDIPRPSNLPGRTSSVDLIAEQYQALLEARSSVYADSISEPESEPQGRDEPLALRPRPSSDCLAEAIRISAPKRSGGGFENGSPTSEDGTLVSFDEETVYFKPISFSSEPASPLLPCSARQSFADDNLSLQICLDLLTRELSSAFKCRMGHAPETSALQVWVMIEAYERLRDRLAEAGRAREDLRSLEAMFDTWIRALYAIHDSLTGEGRRSERGHGAELWDRGVGLNHCHS